MCTLDPNIPGPAPAPFDPRPLSEIAHTLATRIAGLVERTLNLYEAELAQDEAHLAEQQARAHYEVPLEEASHEPEPRDEYEPYSYRQQENSNYYLPPPAAPRARSYNYSSRAATTREPNTRIAHLKAINGLVRAMEVLIRIARQARELEAAPHNNNTPQDPRPPQPPHPQQKNLRGNTSEATNTRTRNRQKKLQRSTHRHYPITKATLAEVIKKIPLPFLTDNLRI